MLGKHNVLVLLAICIAGATVSAQDIIPVESVHYAGRYDVATHTFYPSSVDPDAAPVEGTPVVLYNNTTTNGSLTTGSGLIATEHFLDWGTANFGGAGAMITDIRIGYATNLVAPASVDLRVRLYQGSAGFGVEGTPVGDYLLTGLPNSSSGGFEGFTVDVTLPTAVNMNDGAIGWSYNSDTSPTTSTGPLLVGPPNAPGVVDAYDRYNETTEAYDGTFFFGGSPMASFFIRLSGIANFVPPSAWEKYGAVKKKMNLNGIGDGTPGSDNTIRIKSTVSFAPVVLVAGVTDSNIFSAGLDMWFYALPWNLEVGPFVPDPATALYDLDFVMPPAVPAGTTLFMQAFGANLAGNFVNYSNGLKLTVQ